tara:strand:+ start:2320 stop:2523 length:204 start_codon:yes stop_codon:yes gene_type:complete
LAKSQNEPRYGLRARQAKRANTASIRVDQALFGVQYLQSRISALARTISLRMTAVIATLDGFPAAFI